MGECGVHQHWCVAVLERDAHRVVDTLPWIATDEMHLVEVQHTSILSLGAIAPRHINHVVGHILAHHIPWSATESEPLALTNGVEPIAAMLTQFASGGDVDDGTRALAQMAADEVVIVDLSQKTNALTVLACGIGQAHLGGDAAHLVLGQVANGEDDVAQLLTGDLSQKIGLILDGVDSRGQIFHAINHTSGGVVPGGGEVEVVAPSLLEIAELDHSVAHHIGIGSEALLHGAQRISHDAVPIFILQRHHVEGQPIAASDELAHLDVLVGRAVALATLHADADIEQVQILALLYQSMHRHGTIDTSRD